MAKESTIRVFVALADNHSQGIVPVPERIGNGDDPANNLYWGCSDGLPPVFARSRSWKRTRRSVGKGPILEQQTFRHVRYPVTLTAMAYRDKEIKSALTDFFADVSQPTDGPLALTAFIGHNGLMDFTLETPRATGKGKPAIVLCCKSRDYFAPSLRYYQSRGVLMTTQLMYPGAFLLHDALESYLAERPSTKPPHAPTPKTRKSAFGPHAASSSRDNNPTKLTGLSGLFDELNVALS